MLVALAYLNTVKMLSIEIPKMKDNNAKKVTNQTNIVKLSVALRV